MMFNISGGVLDVPLFGWSFALHLQGKEKYFIDGSSQHRGGDQHTR
jgi:hypothetical protein